MYRLAMLLALSIPLAAGCGGSGGDASKPSPSAAAKAPSAAVKTARDKGTEAAKNKAKNAKKKAAAGDAKNNSGSESPAAKQSARDRQAEALQKTSPDKRLLLITTIVKSVAARFGLQIADVQTTDSGRRVKATVTRGSACRAQASQEPNIVLAIKQGAPSVKSVKFMVAGTHRELGYYVLSCKHPEAPKGPGRLVLEHTAVGGPWTSKRFEIKAKHWALEWANVGASMAAIVIPVSGDSKGHYFKPVGSQKPESGRYKYTGRGVFQLKVSGAARWTVRVKEIP